MHWRTIGFEKQKKHFEHLLKQKNFSHAYIFSGPAMIGKKKFVLELAGLLNQRSAENDPDCKLVGPRLTEGETKIYIEDIRELKSFFTLTPVQGPYKIAIIDDADRLTEEASNALLKILEEPPKFSILFLVTARPKLLLSTIISRCENASFLPHSAEYIRDTLKESKISQDDSELITMLADGRIGWTIDCIQNKKLQILKKAIQEFQAVLRQGTFERMQYAKKITEDNVAEHVDMWIRWIRTHGKDAQKTSRALRQLLQLYPLVAQPQFNHRLLLENFLIQI